MKNIAIRREFPSEYDLRWTFHEVDYAVSSKEINMNLDKHKPQIFISNMKQFEKFKTLWPHNISFLYLHRLVSADEHRQFITEKWYDKPLIAEKRIKEKRMVDAAIVAKNFLMGKLTQSRGATLAAITLETLPHR